MKIGDSISSTYGLSGLFQQSGQRNRQQPLTIENSVRQSGASLAPSTTPTSISSTMWALQATDESQTMSGTEDETKTRNAALASEFSDLANMSLAERIRKQVLDSLGLTEDSLNAMPAEERAAIEKQIAEEVKRQLTGNDDKGTDETTDPATL